MEQVLTPTLVQSPAPATPGGRFRTWHLFAILALGLVALGWFFNHHVITDEVYRKLLSQKFDSGRVDDLINQRAQAAVWGYLAVPAALWVRLAFVAMLLQFFMLLAMVDVPFRRLFTAAAWAFIPLAYEQAVRALWLSRLGVDGITEHTLSVRPGSIASLFMDVDAQGALFTLANYFNGFELLWCVILFVSLRRTGKVSRGLAAAVVLGAWALCTGFQWGLGLYLTRTS
jgi:hypothetical protein